MDLISMRRNYLILSHLKSLLSLKRFSHSLVERGAEDPFSVIMKSKSLHKNAESFSKAESNPGVGKFDISQCKELDSRTLGIRWSMISEPSWIILKLLQKQGFKAYLVGGCVRDLILKRKPKDFDIITTAELNKVKRLFYRSQIIGRRYPICIVHVKNTVIEVSSFETEAPGSIEKKKFLTTRMLSKYSRLDHVLWRDCMRRDFTVNSLFFDPFESKIYDYANGLVDLRSLKLQTLIPARTSFTEDNARILRAVRIAARLCLSFSKDIEAAMSDLSSLVLSISQSRIMMELNYMLCYGAAQPSLSLLQRLGLLEMLLPFQAAYLTRQGNKFGENSTMLMKLFNGLDRMSSCDQPSDSGLWVGLLAFHMALVERPQHPLTVLALASVLYFENWKKAVQFARLQVHVPVCFEPELPDTTEVMSDDELAIRVNQLALLIQESIDVLTDTDSLHEAMADFPGCTCYDLVFVPKNMKGYIVKLFKGIVQLTKHDMKGRKRFSIDYELLQKRDINESRLAIGKIVMETMGCIFDHDVVVTREKGSIEEKIVVRRETSSVCQSQPAKKIMVEDNMFTTVKKELQLNTKMQKVVSAEDKKCTAEKSEVTCKGRQLLPQNNMTKMQKTIKNCEENARNECNRSRDGVDAKPSKKRKLQVRNGNCGKHELSDLFK